MSKHLQQLDVVTQSERRKATVSVSSVTLKANNVLLVLVLVIIPTLSGVALIA
jgi:hypothetical protein